MPGAYERDGETDLSSNLNVLYEQRWLIAIVTLFLLLVGITYAFLATPVYEANVLIHVEEQDTKETRNLITESGALFSMKTSASAEIEMFQSRLVISKAVDKLNLHISAEPDFVPFIGKWLARHNENFAPPGWLSERGYAWGGEKISVADFQVPENFLNREFRLTLKKDGQFDIVEPVSNFVAAGKVGELMYFDMPSGIFSLMITKIDAKTGTRFMLKHASRQVLISDILKRMQVNELGKQSGIIRASLQGNDPEEVYNLLNEIAKAYITQNGRRKTQEADAALAFLRVQLPETKKQLDLSEARYSAFRNQNSTIDLGEEAKIKLQQSSALKTRKIELDQKRLDLLTRFMPDHPFVKGVDAQLAAVNAEIRQITGAIKTLPQIEQELVRLSRDVKVNTELYIALVNTARQLEMTTVAKTSNVRLVDMPIMPEKPVSPNRVRAAGVSLLMGLVLGVIAAFIRKSLRVVIDNPEKMEDLLGVPVYAAIPHSKAQMELQLHAGSMQGGVSLLASSMPMDVAIESLRSFRTVLQYTLSKVPGKVVLMTGPTAGTGKSFASANLAALLGSGGKKVLLIDGDLRNGNLHRCFGVSRRLGLSEAVMGTKRIDNVIHRNVLPDVDFLSTGSLVEESSELLMRPTLPWLIESLEAQYDIMLIDGAPLLEVSDSILLGMHASAIYLVTRSGVTTASDVTESLKRLAQAGLSANGFLFNDVPVQRRQYSYGYGRHWQVQYAGRSAARADI
jgi:tyrosine-protein kinase Etk/Wzc